MNILKYIHCIQFQGRNCRSLLMKTPGSHIINRFAYFEAIDFLWVGHINLKQRFAKYCLGAHQCPIFHEGGRSTCRISDKEGGFELQDFRAGNTRKRHWGFCFRKMTFRRIDTSKSVDKTAIKKDIWYVGYFPAL